MSKLQRDIVFKLKIDDKEFEAKLQNTDQLIDEISKSSQSVGSNFSNIGNIVTGINQGLELLKGAWDILSKPIDVAGEFERYNVQFEVLLGSVDAAEQRIDELAKFAAKTPFEFPEIIRASKQLEVMTGGAIATGDSLKLLGDVSAGVGAPIDELSVWFGRLYDAIQSGRPMGEAMMRLQELGAISGEARGEIEEMQKQGKSADEIWQHFTDSMGRFNGMMEKQSKTTEGMISNLSDAVTLLLRDIGTEMLPRLKENLDFVISAISELSSWFRTSSENAKLAYQEQKNLVDELESSIPGLLDEYDKLQEKTQNGIDVHDELQTVMNDIANFLPTAVTKWDQYGNAIEINKTKVLELLEAEKARLQFLNKDAIEEFEKSIQIAKKRRADLLEELQSGIRTVDFTTPEGKIFTQELKLGEDDIRDVREQIQGLNNDILGMETQLKKLKGEDIEIPGLTGEGKGGGNRLSDNLEDSIRQNAIELDELVRDEINKLRENLEKDGFDVILPDIDLTYLSDYYEAVKYEDDRYYDYKKGLIEDEIDSMRNSGLTEIELNRYKNQRMKELDEEYYNWKWEQYQEDNQIVIGMVDSMWAGYDNFFSSLTNESMSGAERLRQVFESIESAFIGMLANMLKEYLQGVIQRALIGEAAQASSVASAIVTGTSIASAYAPAAALASIATFGAADLAAAAGLTSTVALAQALALGGFEEGGLLPKGKSGFVEGYHNEIIAPEKTFIEVFRNELRPQIYGGVTDNNSELLNELKQLNKNFRDYSDRPIEMNIGRKAAKDIVVMGNGAIRKSR